MNVIQSKNLTKLYGKITALNNLSFEIEENKITGLIGRNGAGKTTLLKTISGHLKPTSGEIKVFSEKPWNNLEVSTKTIFVDDHMSFSHVFTLDDILTEVVPFFPNWNNNLAKGLFKYFALNPKQKYLSLSKGTKSVFNAIIGLSSRCPLTIFDEPTTGMDSGVRKDFYRALLKDYLEHPRTIIISSHFLSEVEEILEDILLLNYGTKCLHLPVTQLKEWAVGLRGNTQTVLSFVHDKQMIHKEEFAKGNIYVVLKRDVLEEQLENIKQSNIEVLPVSIEDLCVYLTDGKQGGIDDVFKRS